MATSSKKPRRTAQRILEVTLDLFNRFGEPNVSTNLISSELGISPGNLYYHYPAKEQLINAILAEFEIALAELAPQAQDVRHVDDARIFFRAWFEASWRYRFLYRDLSDLLSKNRHLEQQFRHLLRHKQQAVETLLKGLHQGGALKTEPQALGALSTTLVMMLTYWLNFEFVRNPRRTADASDVNHMVHNGTLHSLQLLSGHLSDEQRHRLRSFSDTGI